jgi:hypothetical protein
LIFDITGLDVRSDENIAQYFEDEKRFLNLNIYSEFTKFTEAFDQWCEDNGLEALDDDTFGRIEEKILNSIKENEVC